MNHSLFYFQQLIQAPLLLHPPPKKNPKQTRKQFQEQGTTQESKHSISCLCGLMLHLKFILEYF